MQAPDLRWTHRWPDKAGYYWCKTKRPNVDHGRTAAITVVHITRNGSNLLRVGKYSLEEIHQYSERLWAGPLVPPNASDCED